MIGPEARKADHIKEHLEMGEDNGSDFTEGKADTDGHADGQVDGHMEKLQEGGRTHSEDALDIEGIRTMNDPEKTIA